jgi:putative nucleotidyltransferase with HDIG domain
MELPILEASNPYRVAVSIVRKLRQRGFVAYFAGGSIRDSLLGLSPKDIDIATSARPEEVNLLFRRTIATGVQFGVQRVIEEGFDFEVATFRSDGLYIDGRRPVEVHFAGPEDDAARRDFTVNGMFYDPIDKRLIDHVGGREDLRKGIIRAIGVAAERFREDRLRLLRAIRFAAHLEFQIEANTWAALCERAGEITIVSPERIRDELVKILADSHRLRGFELLDLSGLLAVVLPEVEGLKGCEQPEEFHPEGDVFVHTRKMLGLLGPEANGLQAFAVLLHDIGKPSTRSFDAAGNRIRFNGHDRIGAEMAEKVMARLRFSRQEIDVVVEAVRNHMIFKDVQHMRPARLKRFMARPNFDVELELHRVDCAGSHGDLANYRFLVNKGEEFAKEPLIPPPLVRGDDLLKLGMTPGPRIGELLHAIQTAQLEGEIKTHSEAINLLKTLEPTLKIR